MFSSARLQLSEAFTKTVLLLGTEISDDDLASAFKELIQKMGVTLFLEYYDGLPIFIRGNDGEMNHIGKILHSLIKKNYHNTLKVISETGIDLNEVCYENETQEPSFTPLALAVIGNNEEAVEILLEKNVSLQYRDRAGNNLLHLAPNPVICEMLLAAAFDRKIEKKLLREKNKSHQIPLQHAFARNLPEVVLALHRFHAQHRLMKLDVYQRLTTSIVKTILQMPDTEKWIHVLRTMNKYVNQYFGLDRTLIPPPLQVNSTQDLKTEAMNSYDELFNGPPEGAADLKMEALKMANAYCHALLNNPSRCLPALQYLNKEFGRYYAETHPEEPLEIAGRDQYEFKILDRTAFAVPGLDSRYFDDQKPPFSQKHSALKEFLLLLLRKHGLGDEVVKWVGFVPAEFADATIQGGKLVLESNISGAAILHGVYSHMLQLAIILIAIEQKFIPLNYLILGSEIEITANDLVTSQINIRDKSSNPVWAQIRDVRKLNVISFSDPQRLNSFIMYHGSHYGMEMLSNYLIDSECKALVKLHRKVAETNKLLQNFELFIEIFLSASTRYVLNFPVALKTAIKKYEGDPVRFSLFNKSADSALEKLHAVVRVNHYRPNANFKF